MQQPADVEFVEDHLLPPPKLHGRLRIQADVPSLADERARLMGDLAAAMQRALDVAQMESMAGTLPVVVVESENVGMAAVEPLAESANEASSNADKKKKKRKAKKKDSPGDADAPGDEFDESVNADGTGADFPPLGFQTHLLRHTASLEGALSVQAMGVAQLPTQVSLNSIEAVAAAASAGAAAAQALRTRQQQLMLLQPSAPALLSDPKMGPPMTAAVGIEVPLPLLSSPRKTETVSVSLAAFKEDSSAVKPLTAVAPSAAAASATLSTTENAALNIMIGAQALMEIPDASAEPSRWSSSAPPAAVSEALRSASDTVSGRSSAKAVAPSAPDAAFPPAPAPLAAPAPLPPTIAPAAHQPPRRAGFPQSGGHRHHHLYGSTSLLSAPVSAQPAASSREKSKGRSSKVDIWKEDVDNVDRARLEEFWQSLQESERRSLLRIEKDAIFRKMREQKKFGCTCAECGSQRILVEEELESLFDHYNDQVEASADAGSSARSLFPYSADDGADALLTSNFTVRGGVLTVADDLLRNDGHRFMELMDQLASQRQRDQIDEDEYEDYNEEDDAIDDQDEDERAEEMQLEEGRRMFQSLAAMMFEGRVMAAYRTAIAEARQRALIEEEEEKERQERDKKQRKQDKNERKRLALQQKREQEAKQKEEEKRKQEEAEQLKRKAEDEARQKRLEMAEMKRRAEEEALFKAAEAAKARKEAERQKLEAERQKQEAERQKQEAERQRQEVERQKQEAAERQALAKKQQQQASLQKSAAAPAKKATVPAAAPAAAPTPPTENDGEVLDSKARRRRRRQAAEAASASQADAQPAPIPAALPSQQPFQPPFQQPIQQQAPSFAPPAALPVQMPAATPAFVEAPVRPSVRPSLMSRPPPSTGAFAARPAPPPTTGPAFPFVRPALNTATGYRPPMYGSASIPVVAPVVAPVLSAAALAPEQLPQQASAAPTPSYSEFGIFSGGLPGASSWSFSTIGSAPAASSQIWSASSAPPVERDGWSSWTGSSLGGSLWSASLPSEAAAFSVGESLARAIVDAEDDADEDVNVWQPQPPSRRA